LHDDKVTQDFFDILGHLPETTDQVLLWRWSTLYMCKNHYFTGSGPQISGSDV